MERNWLKSIALQTKWIEKPEVKRYVVAHWEKVVKITEDADNAVELLDALCTEDLGRIKKFI